MHLECREKHYENSKMKHGKIVFLAKTKLYSAEALISKSLIDSYISQDAFVLVDNVLS